MKKYIGILLFMLAFTFCVVSQDTTIVNDQTVTVSQAQDTNPLRDAFTTFLTLVAAIPIIVEFVKRLLDKTKATPDWVVQAVSWATGLIVTLFGWLLHLGFLDGMPWYWMLAYGFGASLAANGIADTKLIQNFFDLFIRQVKTG